MSIERIMAVNLIGELTNIIKYYFFTIKKMEYH